MAKMINLLFVVHDQNGKVRCWEWTIKRLFQIIEKMLLYIIGINDDLGSVKYVNLRDHVYGTKQQLEHTNLNFSSSSYLNQLIHVHTYVNDFKIQF